LLVLLAGSLFIAGCSIDAKVEVRSNGNWSGDFAGTYLEGSGNRTVNIPDDPPQCVSVELESSNSYLEVELVEDGGMWLLNPTIDYPTLRTETVNTEILTCTEE